MIDGGETCTNCQAKQMPPWKPTATARACQECEWVEVRSVITGERPEGYYWVEVMSNTPLNRISIKPLQVAYYKNEMWYFCGLGNNSVDVKVKGKVIEGEWK